MAMNFKERLAVQVVKNVSAQQLIKAAENALVEGWDSPSLRMLAGINEQDCDEWTVLRLLNNSLAELGITLPSKDDAVWILLCHHISQIANGTVSPLEGMQAVEKYSFDFYEMTKEYVGDSHDIHEMYGMFWNYEDIRECPDEVSVNGKFGEDAVDELDRFMVEKAREWVGKHCGKFGQGD